MHNLFHLFMLIHNFYLLKLSIIQEKKKKKIITIIITIITI